MHFKIPFLTQNSAQTRFLKGIFALTIGQGVNLLTRVIMPPLFLYAWGVHTYAIWLMLSSIVAYLGLSHLGGQLYVINRLTQLYADKKYQEYRTVFNNGLALFTLIPGTIYIIFVATILLLPQHVLHTTPDNHGLVVTVLILLGFQILVSIPQGFLTGIYQTCGKLPVGAMLNNAIIAGQLLLPAIALLAHTNMIVIATLQIIPILFIIIITAHKIQNAVEIKNLYSMAAISINTIKSFIKPSLHFFSIQLSLAFSIQGIIIIIGLILSPLAVVVFSTMRTIINMMRQILNLIIMAIWPELTRLEIQNKEKLVILFRFTLRTTLILTTLVSIILYHIGGPIYQIWLHHKVPFNQALFSLFLIYGIELIFWTACSNLLMAINKHHALARIYLLASLLSIGTATLGGYYFNLYGVITGIILIDILIPAWIVPVLLHRFEKSFNFKFFATEIFPIIGTLAIASITPWQTLFIIIPTLTIWGYNALPEEIQEKFKRLTRNKWKLC